MHPPEAISDHHQHLALVHGATDHPLWSKTLGQVVDEQAERLGEKTVAVLPWQNVRISFQQLAARARRFAAGLLRAGLQRGDNIAIMAGNRVEYLEVVIGGALIGCPVLVVNNTYKPWELRNALHKTSCRMLFLASTIGSRSMVEHFQILTSPPDMHRVVMLGDGDCSAIPQVQSYATFIANSKSLLADGVLQQAMEAVEPSEVLSLQFTSGTTGEPKASMLTHIISNLLNNARFLGQRMELTTNDIVCCPPPLFHCFGLVMAFFSTLIHGGTIVFPSDHFNPDLVLDAITQEKCTTLLGVPTMFIAEMEANRSRGYRLTTLHKGMIAGSPVSLPLMADIQKHMGIDGMVIAYGMTETSTITFSTSLTDSPENRAKTVGRVMPQVTAKIVNPRGETVRRGEIGELCISGYALQKGYWSNELKTKEVMRVHDDGVLWMHTGDECLIDEDGYCHAMGRIKDIIIRGGENIFPAEIEERLLLNPGLGEASVVGVNDSKYGEVVGCFLKGVDGYTMADNEIKDWVRSTMGTAKTPQHVFWIGADGVCADFPKTGSGKHQKHLLREMADELLGHRRLCKDTVARSES
ncbi:hypothetical protein FE257_011424 [Aspergillus nanangensis]|uniref:Acetyl-CoA synthetase-like protein n=1 Tax=Aspergillus nanangensis TaxID=2582783 RepID=A0AAD4CJ32_ASPNN|nr:hypothetical protein FE257_011424 [Aspergillus nanangensis]